MQIKLDSQPHSEIKISVNTDPQDYKLIEERVIKKLSAHLKLSGFRPGKAPLHLSKKQIDPERLLTEILQELLTYVYLQALSKHNLQTIGNPKVKISQPEKVNQLEDLKSLQIEYLVATYPAVKLGDFHTALRGLKQPSIATAKTLNEATRKASQEKAVQNKRIEELGQKTPAEQGVEEENSIIDKLLETVEVEAPPLLVDDEINRRLKIEVEKAQKIGLTFDEYLKSQHKTLEQLKVALQPQAEKTVRLRFILAELAKEFNHPLEKEEDFRYTIDRLKEIVRSG